jgi:hypothetical protein
VEDFFTLFVEDFTLSKMCVEDFTLFVEDFTLFVEDFTLFVEDFSLSKMCGRFYLVKNNVWNSKILPCLWKILPCFDICRTFYLACGRFYLVWDV